jgi:hypothetical protein
MRSTALPATLSPAKSPSRLAGTGVATGERKTSPQIFKRRKRHGEFALEREAFKSKRPRRHCEQPPDQVP